MKTLALRQGTPEWAAFRAKHHGSSEAPAMMGASKKVQRNELLRMKATGSEKEFSQWVLEVLFARGHEVEIAGRAMAEQIIGDDLFPAIGESDDYPWMSSSFDGIDMAEEITFECKQWNEAKAAIVREGRVPEEDIWQCTQQRVTARSKRHLYMVTDGTPQKTVYCWIEGTVEAATEKALVDGWKQFDEDVASFKPEAPRQEFIGKTPDNLPALHIEVKGAVQATNLPEFKAHALEVIGAINTELSTDQQFADAETAVKWCADVEQRIEAAKQHALSQTASIDELFRALDEISELTRNKRLTLSNLVKNRKVQIRDDAIQGAIRAFLEHCNTINKRWSGRGIFLPAISYNFAERIRGFKTITTLQNAIDTELARVKIEANRVGEVIDENLRQLKMHAEGFEFLFHDLHIIAVSKQTDDFVALVKTRVAEHKAEQARISAAKLSAVVDPQPATSPKKPRSAEPQPAATTSPTAQRRVPIRPDDGQIVTVLVAHFQQPPADVIGWLKTIDFERLEAKLAEAA